MEKNSKFREQEGFQLGERRQINSLQDHHITQLATGQDHLMLLTDQGQVITLGDDTYG